MGVLSKINILEFECGDWTLALLLALRACDSKNAEIFFPPGTYDFYPEKAYGEYSEIPNHDCDEYRKYAIYLCNCENIKITGEQADFIFHGDILPVFIKDSKNICLEGFSVDFAYPCYALATIVGTGEDYFELDLERSEKCVIKDNWLFFDRGPLWGMTEYECFEHDIPFVKAINLNEDVSLQSFLSTGFVDCGRIVFKGKMKQVPRIGNKMLLRYGKRDFPAIFASLCSNIKLNEISVFQARGMGVIIEACRDIEVNMLKVVPSNSGRYLSTCADALHMVNCMGNIAVENCVFENQMDDSINIHGIYSLIERIVDENSILVKLKHDQHQGSLIAFAGDDIRFVETDSLQDIERLKIKSISKINSEYCLISFVSRMPETIKVGMVIENVSLRPDKIRISNCISKNNNPRGILISTGGEVVIENNCISSPQAAVRISGDANLWFESGPVEKVIIKNNRFEHCGYSIRNPNKAVIDIDPEIQKIIPDFYYHDTVIVQNNNFSDFTGKLIHGKSFKSLIFTGNKVLHRDWCGKHNLFELEHCKETEIENNKINEACDPALR